MHSRTLWVFPKNSPVRLGVSPTAETPTGFFQSEVLRLYFLVLEHWVVRSVLLPSFSSQFIHRQMWDRQSASCFHPPQFPICCLAKSPLHPNCLSLLFLLVWINVSSLTPQLSGFHTVQFSGNSGWFFPTFYCSSTVVSIFPPPLPPPLLSFFWLHEEAQGIYLCLHLGWKSTNVFKCVAQDNSSSSSVAQRRQMLETFLSAIKSHFRPEVLQFLLCTSDLVLE